MAVVSIAGPHVGVQRVGMLHGGFVNLLFHLVMLVVMLVEVVTEAHVGVQTVRMFHLKGVSESKWLLSYLKNLPHERIWWTI